MGMQKRKNIEKLLAENELKIKNYLKADPNHKRPVTRRDFLRVGITNMALYAAAPSALTLLAKMGVAEAADCVSTSPNANVASYFNLNLSGGWSLAGNWVPYNSNNQPLADYRTLGTAGVMVPTNTVTAFANGARFYNSSATAGFLAGIRSIAGVDALLAKAVFVGLPTVSRDDTNNNRMDPSGLVAMAGIVGSALPPLGFSGSRTGISHYAALGLNPPPPLTVSSLGSIVRGVTFANSQLGGLNPAQQQSLMGVIKNLSDSQAQRLIAMSGGEEFSKLIECGTGKNISNLQNDLGGAVTPTTGFSNIWTGAAFNESNRLSSLVYNVLQGFSGAGGIDFGGYDYHRVLSPDGFTTYRQMRDSQNAQDFVVGATVGRMMVSANLLNKKMFISLLSDGSVATNEGAEYLGFIGDSGDRGCLAFIAFDPARAPSVTSQQIGAFSDNGTVDRSIQTGSDTESASVALFANWARFSGNMALFDKAMPKNNTRFDATFLNKVLRIS